MEDIFKRIMILKELTEIITDMTKQVFEMSYDMKPEWTH